MQLKANWLKFMCFYEIVFQHWNFWNGQKVESKQQNNDTLGMWREGGWTVTSWAIAAFHFYSQLGKSDFQVWNFNGNDPWSRNSDLKVEDSSQLPSWRLKMAAPAVNSKEAPAIICL